MIPARLDLQQERWELMQLAVAIWQPVLILVLCAGLVLAFAHLMTMLGTRWGKRRVSLKALVFSIVVHLTLAAGIISLLPEATPAGLTRSPLNEPPKKKRKDPETFKVQQVFEHPLAHITPPDAPRPVWEQMTEALPQHVERTPAEYTPVPETLPDRPPPEPLAALTQPEITPLPASELVLPTPQSQAAPTPSAPAADSLQATATAAEARPDVAVPEEARTRSEAVATAFGQTESVARPAPGTVDRVSADLDPNRDVTSVAGFAEEMANLQRNDEAATIERREGPVPSTLDVPEAGIGRVETDEPGQTGAALQPQIARERTPARQGRETIDEPVERYRPDGVPGLADPSVARPALAESSSLGPAVSGLTSEAPSLERMELAAATSSSARVPAPYVLREPERRQQAVEQFGGSRESEDAVRLALKWLADNQNAGSFWDADTHGGGSVARKEGNQDLGFVGREADTGITGLALLAFLANGNTWEQGEYAENVDRGLRWLISQQAANGSLSGAAGTNDGVYCHAIATCALTEAYALRTSDTAGEWLREPVERAVRYTLLNRTGDRGWRYVKEEAHGDMSIFGWQIMSLTNAELGGIPIPDDVRQDLVRFLVQRSLGQQHGLAGYRINEQPSPAMTAEALFCKQKLGISRDNPASAEAVNYLLRYPPHRTQLNYYYWYYATLAMKEYGGEPWERWNAALRDLLVQEQRKSGLYAGSWDPRDVWGIYGGRVYSTAMATLSLEVYYRFASSSPVEKTQPAP